MKQFLFVERDYYIMCDTVGCMNSQALDEYVSTVNSVVSNGTYPTCNPLVFDTICEVELVVEMCDESDDKNIINQLEEQIEIVLHAPRCASDSVVSDSNSSDSAVESFSNSISIWWHVVSMETGEKYRVDTVAEQVNNLVTAQTEQACREMSVLTEMVRQAVIDLDVKSYTGIEDEFSDCECVVDCIVYWCLAASYHHRVLGQEVKI